MTQPTASQRAILVVDLQNDYFPSGKFPLAGVEAATANAARVIAAARASGDPVIHIHHEIPSAEAPFFVPGSPGAEIHPVVAPLAGEALILKHHANSFRETNLQQTLADKGIDTVVVVGAMSHMCIDATGRAAADAGYTTIVVHDACATRDLAFAGQEVPAVQVHAAFMAALAFNYASVVTTADYLAR